jgi:nitrogen fixation protein NifU and related proteins
MTDDLEELYREVIKDHSRSPRNAGALEQPTCHARGENPLCGDRLLVTADVRDGKIRDVRFQGAGCAISTASASLMTEAVKGRTRDDVAALADQFHRMAIGETHDASRLGKLAAFAGVSKFPIRVKCATLAWHTLRAALEGKSESVSTE